jgi:hypothetical protein
MARGRNLHPYRSDVHHMDLDFGLLWIPAGFAFIFLSVAALFLTI